MGRSHAKKSRPSTLPRPDAQVSLLFTSHTAVHTKSSQSSPAPEPNLSGCLFPQMLSAASEWLVQQKPPAQPLTSHQDRQASKGIRLSISRPFQMLDNFGELQAIENYFGCSLGRKQEWWWMLRSGDRSRLSRSWEPTFQHPLGMTHLILTLLENAQGAPRIWGI